MTNQISIKTKEELAARKADLWFLTALISLSFIFFVTFTSALFLPHDFFEDKTPANLSEIKQLVDKTKSTNNEYVMHILASELKENPAPTKHQLADMAENSELRLRYENERAEEEIADNKKEANRLVALEKIKPMIDSLTKNKKLSLN